MEEFISISEAARNMDVSNDTIDRRCNDGKILKEFKFRYLVKSDLGEHCVADMTFGLEINDQCFS